MIDSSLIRGMSAGVNEAGVNEAGDLLPSVPKAQLPRPPSATYKATLPTQHRPVSTRHTELITIAPGLEEAPLSITAGILSECYTQYGLSVRIIEKHFAELAAKHPHSHEFAHEMLRRLHCISKAYHALLPSDSVKDFDRELKKRLAVLLEFGTYYDETAYGSVGLNPLAIEKAIEKGNFREQMLLIYSSLWTLLPKVFENSNTVDLVNKELDKAGAGFSLSTNAIDKERDQSPTGQDPVITFFPQSRPLAKFREANGRVEKPKTAPRAEKSKIGDIPDLSLRELRTLSLSPFTHDEHQLFLAGDPSFDHVRKREVPYVAGSDLYEVNPRSEFHREAQELGDLPIISGPSGTTDGFLHGLRYLGMDQYKDAAILALVGWMIPSRDHTLHEIKLAGTWHGIDYTPTPDHYDRLYPKDPDLQMELALLHEQSGFHIPQYYLSPAYQMQVYSNLIREAE